MTGPAQGRPARAAIAASAATALGLVLLGGISAALTSSEPDGQIVAVPTTALQVDPGGPVVDIQACRAEEKGLVVRGRIDPSVAEGQVGNQVLIAVTGASAPTAGQAVGIGFLSSVGLSDAPGVFIFELTWGDLDSQLGIVVAESAPTSTPRTGPVARCPQAR